MTNQWHTGLSDCGLDDADTLHMTIKRIDVVAIRSEARSGSIDELRADSLFGMYVCIQAA